MTTSMTRGAVVLTLLLFLSGQGGAEAEKAQTLRFYFGSNRQGEIEPCGCQTGQIGGLNRLAEYLKRSGRTPANSVFVESGDAFFSLNELPATRLATDTIRAELIARVYRELSLDAYVPGRRDLAAGWTVLGRLAALSGAPFVAANLEPTVNEAKFLQKRAVVTRAGLKIGFFGLVAPEDFQAVGGVAARDPLVVAREEVSALRKAGVDIVVALSYLGLEGDLGLASVPGVDLVFGSRSLDVLAVPRVVGKTLILQADVEGRQVGVLDFSPKAPLKSAHSLIELDKSLEAKNLVSQWMEAHREKIRKLALQSQETRSPSDHGFVAHPFQCKSCHQAQYEFWQKTNHASAYLVLFSKNQHFNPQCVSCHSLGFRAPEGFSQIAHPITLKDPGELKGKQVFVEQLMRAVFGKDKGELDSRSQPERYARLHKRYTKALEDLNEAAKLEKVFVGVQCEHCHGNRHGHPVHQTKSPSRVLEASCLQCHVGNHDPQFNFSKDVVKIACPRM